MIKEEEIVEMKSIFHVQVSLLSTRSQLNVAEQKLASEIDSYFKDHLIYKRNRRMGGRVIGRMGSNWRQISW